MGCLCSAVKDEIYDQLVSDVERYNNDQGSAEFMKTFLMKAPHLIEFDAFYWETSAERLASYFKSAGLMTIGQASRVVKGIVSAASEDEYLSKVKEVLPCLRIKTEQEPYLSPGTCEVLYNQIVKSSYSTARGKIIMEPLVDWESDDVVTRRTAQESEDATQLAYHCLNKNASLVVLLNPISKLWGDEVDDTFTEFTEVPQKPLCWKNRIHVAASKGSTSSVKYCLHLYPKLLNLPNADGDTPVHCAARGNREDTLRLLQSVGALLELENDDGARPLHVTDSPAIFRMLHEFGVDVNATDRNGQLPLEMASIQKFSVRLIETMLQCGADILKPNGAGTYWMQRVINGQCYGRMGRKKFHSFVRGIISQGTSSPSAANEILVEILARNVDNCDTEDESDVNSSVDRNDIERVRVLVAVGANIDSIRDDGQTNILVCAVKGYSELVTLLCANYANTKVCNDRGENLVWITAMNDYLTDTETFLKYKVDINQHATNGDTVLHESYKNKKSIFTFLLEHGANPNEKNKKKQSVLFIAFSERDDAVGETLQDKYKGNIDTKSEGGDTLGHITVRQEDTARLTYFLDRGLKLETVNDDKRTMFHLGFLDTNNVELCTLLVSRGANINAVNKNKEAALISILQKKPLIRWKFDFLIKHKCDTDVKNRKGECALSICILNELNDEGSVLLNSGCRVNDKDSRSEPIVYALETSSKMWFEALVKRGANGLNTKFPVAEEYMNADFFDKAVLFNMKAVNIAVGRPMHLSVSRKMFDVSDFMWRGASGKERHVAAGRRDEAGYVLISRAIVMRYEPLVVELLDSSAKYDISTKDAEGKTPLMHACIAGNESWMRGIFARIGIREADAKDASGKSALWYSAENDARGFCDTLFFNNADVQHIPEDRNGIIKNYRHCLERHAGLLKEAQRRQAVVQKEYNDVFSSYAQCSSAVSNLESAIQSSEREYNSQRSRLASLGSRPSINDGCNDVYEWDRANSDARSRMNMAQSAHRSASAQIDGARMALRYAKTRNDEAARKLDKYKSETAHLQNLSRKEILARYSS